MAIPITVSSWIRIVPAVEYCVVRIRTTPDQIRKPARVTTNDGTPAFVITIACRNPIAVVQRSANGDRRPPRPARIVGAEEERHHDGSHGADERDGEVDLADQEDEDDADRNRRDRRPSAGAGW